MFFNFSIYLLNLVKIFDFGYAKLGAGWLDFIWLLNLRQNAHIYHNLFNFKLKTLCYML
jgi:hypothetical protein